METPTKRIANRVRISRNDAWARVLIVLTTCAFVPAMLLFLYAARESPLQVAGAVVLITVNITLAIHIAFNDYDLLVLTDSQEVMLKRKGKEFRFLIDEFMRFRLTSSVLSSRRSGFHYYYLELSGQKFRIRFYSEPTFYATVLSTEEDINREVANSLRLAILAQLK